MLPWKNEKLYMEHGGKAPRILYLCTTVSRFHAAVPQSKARITLSWVLLFLLWMWGLPGLNLCLEASYLVWSVLLRSYVFWDITRSSPVKVIRRFGRIHRIHLQSRRVTHARSQHEVRKKFRTACCLLHVGFFVVFFSLFDPKDGGYVFLRNVD
jgi:hypothetical protein